MKKSIKQQFRTIVPAIFGVSLAMSSSLALAGFVDYEHSAQSIKEGSSTASASVSHNKAPASWHGFLDYDHSAEGVGGNAASAAEYRSTPEGMFVDWDHSADSIRS